MAIFKTHSELIWGCLEKNVFARGIVLTLLVAAPGVTDALVAEQRPPCSTQSRLSGLVERL